MKSARETLSMPYLHIDIARSESKARGNTSKRIEDGARTSWTSWTWPVHCHGNALPRLSSSSGRGIHDCHHCFVGKARIWSPWKRWCRLDSNPSSVGRPRSVPPANNNIVNKWPDSPALARNQANLTSLSSILRPISGRTRFSKAFRAVLASTWFPRFIGIYGGASNVSAGRTVSLHMNRTLDNFTNSANKASSLPVEAAPEEPMIRIRA